MRYGVRELAGITAMIVVASAASYTVVPGDTLSAIASRHGVSVSELAQTNGVANPDLIRVGQVLTIPGEPAPSATPTRPAGDHPRAHVVQPGESLSAIAARYRIPVADLITANGISNPNRILVGSQLRLDSSAPASVPAGVAPTVPGVSGGGGGVHEVVAGQTLSGIAARYGVSVQDLAAANAITDPNRIRIGQRLVIPGGWSCPVPGTTRFVDDFGAPRSGGRFHEGTDIFAPMGSPIVAPVAGTVTVQEGRLGGKQFRLQGDDGFLYIGTHMQAFGATGRVKAGDLIGQVGDSGNARGTAPHLHFEIHPEGLPPINPYPTLEAAC